MAENHYYNFIWVEHEPRIILVRICRYQGSQEGGEDSIQHWCPPDMIPFGWGHFNTSVMRAVNMDNPGECKLGEEKSVIKSANQVDFQKTYINFTFLSSTSESQSATPEIQ